MQSRIKQYNLLNMREIGRKRRAWHYSCSSLLQARREIRYRLNDWRNHSGSRAVKLCVASALIFCLILWPASADLSDSEPIVSYVLPADIMRVEFADETWVYRLYEDGRVKKIISEDRHASGRGGEPLAQTRLISDWKRVGLLFS